MKNKILKLLMYTIPTLVIGLVAGSVIEANIKIEKGKLVFESKAYLEFS